MDYNYDASAEDGFIRIPSKFSRCKAYINWVGTKECAVYFHLRGFIIRRAINTGTKKIFERFFEKGYLASNFSQEDLAYNITGKENNQGNISRYTKSLIKKGLLKSRRVKTPHGWCSIYIFGTHDRNGHESYYMDEYFSSRLLEEKKRAMEERTESMIRDVNKFNALNDPDSW